MKTQTAKSFYDFEQQWLVEMQPQGLRLGQVFANRYVKQPMPDLYYADTAKARGMIAQWLIDNSYWPYLPGYENSMDKSVDQQSQSY